MDVVARIFALVDAKFPEQKDFAAAIGVDTAIVSRWKNRKSASYTKPEMLSKIAKVLDTTVEYLLTGKEEFQNKPADQLADGWEMEAMQILRRLPPELLERELAYLRSLNHEKK